MVGGGKGCMSHQSSYNRHIGRAGLKWGCMSHQPIYSRLIDKAGLVLDTSLAIV